MDQSRWNPQNSIDEARRLTAAGLLGFYTHFEVTQIVAFSSRDAPPANVFTLVVAEEHPDAEAEEVAPHFLNSNARIKIAELPEWRFGIYRYTRVIDDLVPTLERLSGTGIWDASGAPLQLAARSAQPPQFVPPDTYKRVPWNNVLKNNFWNGSYVLEWADLQKAALAPFFEEPRRLQELSDAVGSYVPMCIASLSDRLGNVAVQLPVTVLMARFGSQGDSMFVAGTGWHSRATPRLLRACVEMEFDDTVSGYSSRPVEGEYTQLPVPPAGDEHRGILWDETNGLILAATGPSAFMRTVAFNLRPLISEPRVFAFSDENGVVQTHRIQVYPTVPSVVGEQDNNGPREWSRRRIYRDETARLKAERRFVQYRPEPGKQAAEHEKALRDIRHLIAQHGEDGAWLWDPYLSARDILKTLFFCPHTNADLRGLTAMKEPSHSASDAGCSEFFENQKQEFANAQSNFLALGLEFRAKTGPAGWAFHDRFLIFPRKDGEALAWSLGTSVNSLGKAHHILQRVDVGQQVRDAFVELWDALSRPEHLVWKAPRR